MPKKNLVVLTSGNGSNLEAIIEHINNGNISACIQAVISNTDSYSLKRAANYDIPAIYLSHKDFKSRETYDKALINTIMPYKPDFIILAGFMRILTKSFINTFTDIIINIHPSLLPKYKGLDTHQQALNNGDSEHGTSVHIVTEALDSGAVIAQSKCEITPSDTPFTLQERIKILEHKLYPEVIQKLCNDQIIIKNGQIITK